MKVFIKTNEMLINSALLVLRISIGAIFFAHGAQKVLGLFGGHGLAATAAMMSKNLPLPAWLFYVSAFAEFLGGIGMILGLLTRFWGIALFITMLVAVFFVHLPNGFFAPMGFEFPGSLALLALAITLAGPGLYSLDSILFASSGYAQSATARSFPVPGGNAAFRT